MSECENAYQLARHVAAQLPQHSGCTARDLYQKFIPEFAVFGTDGSSGATMILQHLRKLEEQGLAISEKGRQRGNPSKWFWVGPATIQEPDPADESTTPTPTPSDQTPEAPAAAHEPAAMGRPAPSWLVETDQAAADEPAEIDPWDELAHQFAAACRAQAAADATLEIADLNEKLGVIEELKHIVCDEIRAVLGAIADDLLRIRGIDR